MSRTFALCWTCGWSRSCRNFDEATNRVAGHNCQGDPPKTQVVQAGDIDSIDRVVTV